MKSKVLFLLLLFTACNSAPADNTPAVIQSKLIKAMSDHLTQGHIKDSGRVKFEVQSVTYFEEKTYFDCKFNVKETYRDSSNVLKDTIGVMAATVLKDFTTVTRKY